MELVDGPDLRQLLAAPLPRDQVAHIAADIAEALHYMHGKGFVHRDIKPANILLAPSALPDRAYRAKLADLGIARLIDSGHLTSAGIIVGSAHYLSPEQARGDDSGAGVGRVLARARAARGAHRPQGVPRHRHGDDRRAAHRAASGSDRARPGLGDAAHRDDRDRSALRPLSLDVARDIGELIRRRPDAGSTEPVATEALEATALLPLRDGPAAARPYRGAWDGLARRRTTLIAAAGIIAVAATAGVISWTTAAQPPSSPTVSYPAVSGSLGVHLKDLQRNVLP